MRTDYINFLTNKKAGKLIEFFGFDHENLTTPGVVYKVITSTLAQLSGQQTTENFSGLIGFQFVEKLTGKIDEHVKNLVTTGNDLKRLYPKRPLLYCERRGVPGFTRVNHHDCFDMLKIDLNCQQYFKIVMKNHQIDSRLICPVRSIQDIQMTFEAIDRKNAGQALKDIFEVESKGVKMGIVGYFNDSVLIDYAF